MEKQCEQHYRVHQWYLHILCKGLFVYLGIMKGCPSLKDCLPLLIMTTFLMFHCFILSKISNVMCVSDEKTIKTVLEICTYYFFSFFFFKYVK